VVVVHGDHTTTTTYTGATLTGMTQQTVGTVTGVNLESLVLADMPTLTSIQGKNQLLAVVATVTGSRDVQRAVALGELDSNFGNHPALLVATPGGLTLEFPSDTDGSRTVDHVFDIQVTVQNPPLDTPPPAAIVVHKNEGLALETLTGGQLAVMAPQQTRTVSYLSSHANTYTETGPTLDAVLQFLDFVPNPATAVWATGAAFGVPAGSPPQISAAVTPAEAGPGGRPLLISTTELNDLATPPVYTTSPPLLVPDGDVKGGRYISQMVSLTILDTSSHPAPQPPCARQEAAGGGPVPPSTALPGVGPGTSGSPGTADHSPDVSKDLGRPKDK
jgi:hypothetical protein